MRSLSVALLIVSALVAVLWLPAVADDPAPTTQPAVEETAPAETTPAEEPMTPAKEQDIRKLLDVTGAGRMGEMMMDQVMQQIVSSNPDMADFVQELRSEMDIDELIESIIPIYAKYFTHEDIKGLVKFWQSPLGQRFIEAQPQVMMDSMQVGQQWGMKLGQKVMRRIQERRGAATPMPVEVEPADE